MYHCTVIFSKRYLTDALLNIFKLFFASIMIAIKDIGQTVYISGNLSVARLHVINTLLACTLISVKWLELKIF